MAVMANRDIHTPNDSATIHQPFFESLPDRQEAPAKTAEGHVHEILLPLAGIDCWRSSDKVRHALNKVDGILSAHTVFNNSAVKVRYDEQNISLEAIRSALACPGNAE